MFVRTGIAIISIIASLIFASPSGCAHVCAKTWETGVEASHSPYFGPGYGTHVTVGGELGPSQCKDKQDK